MAERNDSDDSFVDAATLIELYFELEDPDERDAVFDKLAAIRVPIVDDFLRAMMEEDEDEYARAAAAAELARRGDQAGLAFLEANLNDPDDFFLFEHAVRTLAQLRGPDSYEAFAAIWRNPERDADERREAMIGMETASPERALPDFAAFIDSLHDVHALPDDQVEAAIMAFLRHSYAEAIPVLEGLRERVRGAQIDEEEREELVGLVQEGVDLLSG